MKIFIVDDSALVVERVRALMSTIEGLEFTGQATNANDAVETILKQEPDVVESMASHRPYRPSLGIDAALENIENNRGAHYDTSAVDACLRMFREKGYQLKGT